MPVPKLENLKVDGTKISSPFRKFSLGFFSPLSIHTHPDQTDMISEKFLIKSHLHDPSFKGHF